MEVKMDELWQTLLKFHREIAMPEVRELVESQVDTAVGSLRDDMNLHFDHIYKRFDRMDTELVAIKGGLKRLEEWVEALEARLSAVEKRLAAVEERLTNVEEKLEAVALRSEIEELRERITAAQQRLSVLEARRH